MSLNRIQVQFGRDGAEYSPDDGKSWFTARAWAEHPANLLAGPRVLSLTSDSCQVTELTGNEKEVALSNWVDGIGSGLARRERSRILAWLDSMKPGETSYTRGSAEIERQASMRMWVRIRAAVEGGEDVPRSADAIRREAAAAGACACLGPQNGEPYCYCEMRRREVIGGEAPKGDI